MIGCPSVVVYVAPEAATVAEAGSAPVPFGMAASFRVLARGLAEDAARTVAGRPVATSANAAVASVTNATASSAPATSTASTPVGPVATSVRSCSHLANDGTNVAALAAPDAGSTTARTSTSVG